MAKSVINLASLGGDTGPSRTANFLSLAGGWARNLADAANGPSGGGGSSVDHIEEAAKGMEAAQSAAQQRQQAYQLAKQLYPDDPRAQLAFAADPKGGLTAFYKAQEPATLSEGQVRFGGNGQVLNKVSKTGFQNDRSVTSDPVTGTVSVGALLPMSYGEQTSQQSADQTGAMNAATQQHWGVEDATTRRGQDMSHQVGMAGVGIAGGQLNLGKQRFGYEQFHDLAKDHPDALVLKTPEDYAKVPRGAKYIAPGENFPRTKQ